MLIKWIATLIVAINANRRAGEIAAGVACGCLLGIIPSGNMLWVVLFILTFFIKINLAVELLFLALCKLLAPLLDGLLHSLGYFVLTQPFLQGLFTSLYNVPLVPYSQFNNTIVMGGLIGGIILWLPVFFLFHQLVILYRKKLRDKIAGSKIIKAFGKLPFVDGIAQAVKKLGGIYAGVS